MLENAGDKIVDQLHEEVVRPRLSRLTTELHGRALSAFVSAAGVAAVVVALEGRAGLVAWDRATLAAVVVVAAGCLGWIAGSVWTGRHRPLVVLSRFSAVGGAEAQSEAAQLQESFKRALEDAAGEDELRDLVHTRVVPRSVDAHNERSAALRLARSHRSPVLVAGAVRRDQSGLDLRIQIIASNKQHGWGGTARHVRELPFDIPDAEIPVVRKNVAERAAVAAQLALGLALLQTGRWADAQRVLSRPTTHPDHLMLFYAAYAAFMLDDAAAVRTFAGASFQLHAWAPTAGLLVLLELSRERFDEAAHWRRRGLDDGTEQASGDWNERLLELQQAPALLSLLHDLNESQAALHRRVDQARASFLDDLESLQTVQAARRALLAEDWSGAVRLLQPRLEQREGHVWALFAAAAAHLHADSGRWTVEEVRGFVATAEELGAGATARSASHRHLVDAYVVLQDAEGACRTWRASLEATLVEDPTMLSVRLLLDRQELLGRFAGHPDVLAIEAAYGLVDTGDAMTPGP